jgi:N-acetylglucosaminyl-diphospho-decaprenol L-rhamnosyltransferase
MKAEMKADKPAKSVLTITVTYKSAEWTAKSLKALAAERARLGDIDVRTVIVDNASGDTPALRRVIDNNGWQDWATLITADRNGGFAYGNNVGLRHGYAQERLPDYFYLLNPDAEVRPGAIETLVAFLEKDPKAGLAASSIEEENGELWPWAFRFPSWASELESGLSFGPVSKLLDNHTVRRKMGAAVEQVDWFPGAAMMMRRELVDDIGGLDESYFLYFEETDYLRRAKEANWTAWYVPQSRVTHSAGQSTGVTTRRDVPLRLPTYWFESRRRYFAKNHGLPYAAVTDVAALAAYSLGALKRTLQGRPSIPHFVRDLIRHSVLWKENRTLAPVSQFKPEPTPTSAPR